jgi:acetyl-CoA synthetase
VLVVRDASRPAEQPVGSGRPLRQHRLLGVQQSDGDSEGGSVSEHDDFVAELIAERQLPADDVWKAAEARLDWPVSKGLNTAHEACDRWARDRARLAMILVHPDGRREQWTFAELSRASRQLATAWADAGLQRGDRVAGLIGQQVEAYIAALAAWRAGFVYLPLFVGFGAGGLAQRLKDGDPAAVVVDAQHRGALGGALELMETEPLVYTIAGAAGTGLVRGDFSFWAELGRHGAHHEMVVTTPDATATLMYTSGTTGAPKGCLQSHSLPLTIQPFLRHTFALEPGDMLFTGANPGWSYGLYTTGIGPMSLGHPRVVYTGNFDPQAWLKVFEQEHVTYVAAAPSAFRRLTAEAQRHGLPESIRGATSAGEPLDAPLATAWRDLAGSDIQDGYGASETAMVLANLAYPEAPAVPGALTSVTPGFEVELVDDNGREQATEGILALRHPRYQASNGYRLREGQWAARWRGDRFLTGDMFRLDADGRYRFVGRSDDLIVTSGYNVGPSEVEEIILAHPAVTEAAVVGAPDAARGTVVRAVVVTNGSVPPDQLREDLRNAVRDRLGRHAYPRIIDFVDELPKTDSGKVRRNLLRSPA